MSTCFTPGPTRCAEVIVAQLDAALAKVRVQAYYLTSPVILHAIAAAKRRGLVAVILDKSQDRHDSLHGRHRQPLSA